MDRAYVAENARERERLRTLVSRLTDADLTRTLEKGWTIAGTLAHLAFWDQRQLTALKRWQETGVEPSPVDADAINEAVSLLGEGIPSRRAGELALATAEKVDQELEALSSEWVARIESRGNKRLLLRALHRHEHLDQIERILKTV